MPPSGQLTRTVASSVFPSSTGGRADDGQAGLPDPEALISREEEQLVVQHRPAQSPAELVLPIRRLAAGIQVVEEIVSVKLVVAKVIVSFAVELIAATFGDHIYRGDAVSELRIHARDVDLDFLNRGGRLLRKQRTITLNSMTRTDVLRMVMRRALEAGLPSSTCCHTFRATGITAYLENGGTIENAQAIAAHESPRTTKLYDRTGDEITLDDVERIAI
jgi:Phage integrase family